MTKCLDYYDEPLKVGDKIISVITNEKIIDDVGIITKIYFNPKNKCYYLTILNETGFLLTKRKAENYTTIKRYEKYNPIEYTYFLDLDCVSSGRYLIALDNNTHLRIDFPEFSFMAILYARYKTGVYDQDEFIPKFGFILDENITIKSEKIGDREDEFLYKPTLNGKTYRIPLGFFPYRTFKTKMELIKYLQGLIKYFHEVDLSMFSLDIPFQDNELSQKFDYELMRKLKH